MVIPRSFLQSLESIAPFLDALVVAEGAGLAEQLVDSVVLP
jgi:hypothetical protein